MPRPTAVLALACALAPAAVVAQTGPACAREADDARRLACYDSLFRAAAAAPGASAAPQAMPAPPASAPAARAETAPAPFSNWTEKLWELTPADKRGVFVVRTYRPNFVLPLHVTNRINRRPHSPTLGAPEADAAHKTTEAKLQVSLRAKVAEGLLLPGADLWFAYTQRSLWQVWNSENSSPFRSTDYEPEAIYVVPVPAQLGTLPQGWRWRMAQLGLAHQSNGQSAPLSRSWNRVYLGGALDRGEVGLQWRLNRRFKESSNDDNPDLTRMIGNTELPASWTPGRSTALLTWRTNPRALNRGSLQLDWTYPVDKQQPAGLRWYLQLFTGYGETLLDYNHRQSTLGVGVTLFQL
jgi:phospholipase A1